MLEAWRLCQDERGILKEHVEERLHMPVLHNYAEAVYVSKLATFERDVAADRNPEDWLRYCMLLWP